MKRVIPALIVVAVCIVSFLSLTRHPGSSSASADGHVPGRAAVAAHAPAADASRSDQHGSAKTGHRHAPVQAKPAEGVSISSIHSAPADWRRFDPDTLTLSVPGVGPVVFRHEFSATRADLEVWRGRPAGRDGAFLVAAASQHQWSAVVSLPGQPSYEISIGADGLQRATAFDGPADCGSCVGVVKGSPLASVSIGSPEPHAASAAPLTIDVLFIYEATALNDAGGNRDLIATRLAARMEASNAVLANSNIVNFTWNYLGALELQGYTRTGKLEEDLAAIADPGNGAGAFAKQKADEYGADQVVFIVGDPIDWGGLAYTPGRFSVVGWSQTPYYTLTHELGHNFGCNHDRTTESAPDSNGKYAYGHRYTSGTGEDTGTVMSYAKKIIPYFSNPDVSYLGVPTGVAEGQPKAANNARVVREYAGTLAAVRNPAAGPIITSQPSSLYAQAGDSGSLSVGAVGAGATYQWKRNGDTVTGATAATLSFPTLTSAEAGRYQCVITNASGTSVSQEVDIQVQLSWDPNPLARLVNISTRSTAEAGGSAQIAGFVVDGPGSLPLLIRASGPALSTFGVGGVIADPLLELRLQSTGALAASNDNWSSGGQGAALQTAFSDTGAFAWTTGSKDAALLQSLPASLYSGVVTPKSGSGGVALIEVYERSPLPGTRLTNISTRSLVGSGNEAQIAGFVVGGSGLKTLLIRASGPALKQFLGSTTVVEDPKMELYDQGTNRKIVVNDNWGDDDPDTISYASSANGAFAWESGSADAAFVVTLRPGLYSAVVQSKGDAGVGLVEVYDANK